MGAILISHPEERVRLIGESAVVVFDPLARSQSTLFRWRVEGSTQPFAVLIPVPEKARVSLKQTAPFERVQRVLHPVGRVRRDIRIDFKSWVGNCLVREVGDTLPAGVKAQRDRTDVTATKVEGEPTSHQWFLDQSLTLAPAQAAWLEETKALGWSVVAVRFAPPEDARSDDVFATPVVAITHRATEPRFTAHTPGFTIADDRSNKIPLELSVITEWPVTIAAREEVDPFVAVPVSEKLMGGIAKSARGMNWSFRRAGLLTAFRLTDRGPTHTLAFSRTESQGTVRPPVQARLRPVVIPIPLEGGLLVGLLLIWAWLGSQRRKNRGTTLR